MPKNPFPIRYDDTDLSKVEALQARLHGLAKTTGVLRAATVLGLDLLASMTDAELAQAIKRTEIQRGARQ
jgi:hypothetical protein